MLNLHLIKRKKKRIYKRPIIWAVDRVYFSTNYSFISRHFHYSAKTHLVIYCFTVTIMH